MANIKVWGEKSQDRYSVNLFFHSLPAYFSSSLCSPVVFSRVLCPSACFMHKASTTSISIFYLTIFYLAKQVLICLSSGGIWLTFRNNSESPSFELCTASDQGPQLQGSRILFWLLLRIETLILYVNLLSFQWKESLWFWSKKKRKKTRWTKKHFETKLF